MSGDSSALMQLGIVGAPFGVRGWVKLRSHADPPDSLLEHRSLHLGRSGAWTEYRVEERGRSGGALTVKFVGIDDRDRAASLRGLEVCVPRSNLPPRDAKDFYRSDLIGCEVVSLAGAELGRVLHFVETPAHSLMVVRGAKEYWIPAVPQHLRKVDLAARRVVVDWAEAAD